jgi:hypothetical protein
MTTSSVQASASDTLGRIAAYVGNSLGLFGSLCSLCGWLRLRRLWSHALTQDDKY